MEWNLNHYPWYVSFILGAVAGIVATSVVRLILRSLWR